jgi:isopenicillin N synthase-like dioxygenase
VGFSDDPKRKQKFVNEIGSAFEDIGFVALKGHFRSIEELYGEIGNFFSLYH